MCARSPRDTGYETADDRLGHLPHICRRDFVAPPAQACARWIALATTVAGLVLGLDALWQTPVSDLASFATITRIPWIPALGINYHLALDGISLTLVRHRPDRRQRGSFFMGRGFTA